MNTQSDSESFESVTWVATVSGIRIFVRLVDEQQSPLIIHIDMDEVLEWSRLILREQVREDWARQHNADWALLKPTQQEPNP